MSFHPFPCPRHQNNEKNQDDTIRNAVAWIIPPTSPLKLLVNVSMAQQVSKWQNVVSMAQQVSKWQNVTGGAEGSESSETRCHHSGPWHSSRTAITLHTRYF